MSPMKAETSQINNPLVEKKVIYAGTGEFPTFENGTKLTFHFKTAHVGPDCKNEDDETVLDDSKKAGKPMELLLGKQFRMPVWEECLKTMRVGEISEFTVKKQLLDMYPMVSKTYRQYSGISKKEEGHQSHCCGGMGLHGSIGHPDLDEWMRTPTDLKFTFELVKAEAPGDYEKESWSMDPEEKLNSVPKLRDEGNRLYKEGRCSEAAVKYGEALTRLDQLLLREKPGDAEWKELAQMKIPLLLNFSQCKLKEGDYYAVIEHTSSVLELDPDNVKALFRRAKAHMGAWNPEKAREDFTRVLQLDSSLKSAVNKELRLLEQAQKEKDKNDRAKLQGKLFS